jgi:hypothetical protein
MITAQYIDCLDRAVCCLRGVDKPFEGIQMSAICTKRSSHLHPTQVISVGDFLQLLPVLYLKESLAFQARCWKDLFSIVICLSTVHRQVDQGSLHLFFSHIVLLVLKPMIILQTVTSSHEQSLGISKICSPWLNLPLLMALNRSWSYLMSLCSRLKAR